MVDIIVIGLDGANWNLVEPWLRDGELPNLATLRKSGTYGDLRSCLPPVTCPNWRCYSTGKNPGKLGVYWWEQIDTESRSLETPNSRSFKSTNYWDYLNDEGYTAGIVNLPMTYPPFEIDDYMISGGPGSEQVEYATPASLQTRLDERDYRLHPSQSISSKDDDVAAAAVNEIIDDRFTTFRRLLKDDPVDVAHLTIFYSNVLQHWFWRDEPTKRAWKTIDSHLGELRADHPDANILIMSDHGCIDINTVFHINSWLEQNGYLVTEGTGSIFQSLGINKQRIIDAIEPFDILRQVASLAPDKLKSSIPETSSGFKREQKLDKIDWESSQAIASGQGLVYILGDESVRDNVMDDLRDLENPHTGEPVASAVHSASEIYHGPEMETAPDIIFEQYPGIHTTGVVGDNQVFADPDGWQAENIPTGLFLANGPDIQEVNSSQIMITDIAPTILNGMGCELPTDMDGEPLGIFGGAPPNRKPIPFTNTSATLSDSKVESRLEDLGYLS